LTSNAADNPGHSERGAPVAERRQSLTRVQVAAILRQLREGAGLPRDAAARTLGCTVSKIGDLETGRSGVKPAELVQLLELYGTTGAERDALTDAVRTWRVRPARDSALTSIPTTKRRYVNLEAQARSLTFYSSELLPGFLQTDAYARAVLKWSHQLTPTEISWRLALRAERRRILARRDPPGPACWCILGEGALRTGVGGPHAMAEQVAYIIEQAELRPNLVVQVLPFGAGVHQLMGMTHTLLRFDPPAGDILHVDTYPRNVYFDNPRDVTNTAHALEMIKLQALNRIESLAMLRRIASEYSELPECAAME
jgi:hypothetical protein